MEKKPTKKNENDVYTQFKIYRKIVPILVIFFTQKQQQHTKWHQPVDLIISNRHIAR